MFDVLLSTEVAERPNKIHTVLLRDLSSLDEPRREVLPRMGQHPARQLGRARRQHDPNTVVSDGLSSVLLSFPGKLVYASSLSTEIGEAADDALHEAGWTAYTAHQAFSQGWRLLDFRFFRQHNYVFFEPDEILDVSSSSGSRLGVSELFDEDYFDSEDEPSQSWTCISILGSKDTITSISRASVAEIVSRYENLSKTTTETKAAGRLTSFLLDTTYHFYFHN
ncbi:hypothetical protein C8J56DRAFT_1157805 [Mycena floridula]|nr:hypothetical protein C8J56DRAFT_1157805 [Mycena floridula]